jgi:ABC-type transporter Mla MlaB component
MSLKSGLQCSPAQPPVESLPASPRNISFQSQNSLPFSPSSLVTSILSLFSLTEGREVCWNLSQLTVLDTCCLPLFCKSTPVSWKSPFSGTSQHHGAGTHHSLDSSSLVVLVSWLQGQALRMAHFHQIMGFCWKNQKRKPLWSTGLPR